MVEGRAPMNNGWNENRFVKRKGSKKEVDFVVVLILLLLLPWIRNLTFELVEERIFGIEMDRYKYHK